MARAARIPEEGERVQMGEYATAFRGVWGQVIRVDRNFVDKLDVWGNPDGHDRTDLYIMADLPYYQGKKVVIRASPYELDGALE